MLPHLFSVIIIIIHYHSVIIAVTHCCASRLLSLSPSVTLSWQKPQPWLKSSLGLVQSSSIRAVEHGSRYSIKYDQFCFKLRITNFKRAFSATWCPYRILAVSSPTTSQDNDCTASPFRPLTIPSRFLTPRLWPSFIFYSGNRSN